MVSPEHGIAFLGFLWQSLGFLVGLLDEISDGFQSSLDLTNVGGHDIDHFDKVVYLSIHGSDGGSLLGLWLIAHDGSLRCSAI